MQQITFHYFYKEQLAISGKLMLWCVLLSQTFRWNNTKIERQLNFMETDKELRVHERVSLLVLFLLL